MGTPEFAVPSLEHIAEAGYGPVAVVTGPDRPRGRGQKVTPTPVKKAASRLGVGTILQPESVRSPEFAADVAGFAPDVIVVVAFKILPPSVFSKARKGAFNLHGSLLPKYRGAAPINRAVMSGERETGVTTFFLQEAVDTGEVILQRSMPIGPNETAGSVHDRMKQVGAEAVLETIQQIEDGTVQAHPQDDAEATPAPKINREDGRIPWQRPARDVHNHIRGLSPYPGAWTRHEGTQLKVYRALPAEGAGPAGTVLESSSRFIVACGEDAVELLEVQQQGRRRMEAGDFLNGYALPEGTHLG